MQQALSLGAGYLATPIVSSMVPFRTTTKLGEYAKTAIVATIGGQVVGKVMGKKYGNALMAGGWLWIAVDALSSQVTFFAPARPSANGEEGMGAYFPPFAELESGAYDPLALPATGSRGGMPAMRFN